MDLDYRDFIHPNHFTIFVEAAKTFDCYILVRETGRAALSWVGKSGYTGKRADMKAKTANLNVGHHPIAGLVCSPFIRPEVFTSERLKKAYVKWEESLHLITVPRDKSGFDDNRQLHGCFTPYIVQTNPNHKHYGCIALVEMGLLVPRYVHGDYDLYAIISPKQVFEPGKEKHKTMMGSTMAPDQLGLKQRLQMEVENLNSSLSFQVANFINLRIEKTSPDLLGALMVNHGEQVNIADGHNFETVLVIMPKQVNGQWVRILATREEHEQFYRESAAG